MLSCVDAPRPGHQLRAGAVLDGRGWAISEAEITSISVYLGDSFLCYASYGQPRPEIGREYSHYPQALHSGFVFSVRLGAEIDQARGADLEFRFATAGSESRRILHLAWPEPAAPAESQSGLTPPPAPHTQPWPIRLAVEDCRIDAGHVLRLRGWVISRSPLTSLQLFLDDLRLDTPEQQLDRPDIARRYPTYPGAAASGFMLVQTILPADIGLLDIARASVRVVARAPHAHRQIVVPLAPPGERRLLLEGGDVTLACDTLRLAADGSLAVAGWVVGPAETREVELIGPGGSLGLAEIGLPRPDIGNRFPRLPNARWSGFRFLASPAGERALAPGSAVTLVVRDTAGGERRMELRLPDFGTAAAAERIHSGIDTPSLSEGRAETPVRGMLNVAGWAVSASGIAGIDVWLDETRLGEAYLGMRREDIAATYPELPGALQSGFALTVPSRLVSDGEHGIRVVIRAVSGTVAEESFRFVAQSADDRAVGHIRPRIPYAEVVLRLELLRHFGAPPEFLVVIRRPGDEPKMLATTLDTLRRQAYPHWRAVVMRGETDAAEELPPGGRARLTTANEPPLHEQMGPHGLLCVLRAGDRLGADALLALAVEHRLSGAGFVYSDERCFDPARELVRPWFKPGWSPDLLHSVNYIGRLWCATRAVVQAAGVDLAGFEAFGEYDAVLRLTEQAARVAHLPEILCERTGRRIDPARREQAALGRAAERRGIDAEVVYGRAPDSWRLRRRLATKALVSIIVPTCGARGLIRTLVGSIRQHTSYPALELIVLDDIPPADQVTKDWLATVAQRVIEVDGPFNWSRCNNIGAAAAQGEFLLFLNDDIEIRRPGWIAALLEHAQRPEVGVVGPQLLYPDGKVQHAGMFLSGPHGRHAFRFAPGDEPGGFGLALTQRDITAVTGACMMVRREVFDRLGGFDERHSVIKNDLDFCLRAAAEGLRIVYTPYASLTHHEMASRAQLADHFDEAGFQSRWALRQLRGDPLLNPNLTLESDEYLPEAEPVEFLQPGHPLLDRDQIRRILVLKLDHIGDFLTMLPVLRRLRAHFPAAEITVLAAAASVLLARLAPEIDVVEQFDFFAARSIAGRRQFGEPELEALRTRLAPRQFDLAVDFRMHPDTRYVLRYTGAAVLAGFDSGGRFPWLDVVVEWEGDLRLIPKRAHITDRLLQLADALGNAAEPNAVPLRLASRADIRATVDRVLAAAPTGFADLPLICIHPGAGTPLKQWPAAALAGLAALLLEGHDVGIVLIGGADEAAIAADVAALAARPDRLVSLAGQVSLSDLPELLQGCILFVGNDSGPKHLAASLGVPTVGVHAAHVDAAEWGPLGPRAIAVRRRMECGPCYLAEETDCPRGVVCLRGITPAQVYRACRLLLGLTRADGSAASM